VSDEEAEQQITMMLQQYNMTQEEFTQQLQQSGMTYEGYIDQIKQQIVQDQLLEDLKQEADIEYNIQVNSTKSFFYFFSVTCATDDAVL
jgi:methylphosphotriester-DNA--protein-cysteine methyltransferase